jgi:hypothetical protein
VSIIWEGMKAQPTFSLPSPALSANYCIMAGLYTPRQAKRKQMVRLIGVGIGRSMAWLPMIPFAFHICQVLIAKRLSLSSNSNFGFARSLRLPIDTDLATVGLP